MKKSVIYFGSIYLLFILLQSCKPNDIYFNLTEEAREFLQFEIGDTFKLKKLDTDEIITLTVNFKEFRHEEDGGPNGSGFISFGPKANYYVEYGEYTFADVSGCYNGSVIVEGARDEEFVLKITLRDCFLEMDDVFEYHDQLPLSINIQGAVYTNAYLLRAFSETLLYSKEKGILQIGDVFGENPSFTIVE